MAAEHHELVAEMPVLEQMGTQERQKLAKKRRNQQLKRWNQREKEWLAKEKQLNKRLANKISEENNGLNLKQYTTYSSNHRSKNQNKTTSASLTLAPSSTSVNGNNNNDSLSNKNNNGTDGNSNNLKAISRFQATIGPKLIGLAPNGRVHFNVGVMLLEAAARNDYDEVKRLLMLGVSPDSINHDGLTALHQCCIDASEPIMSLLLEFGANVDARDTEQWTPLHAACTCGHLNLVKILVENDADLLAVNGDGNMPFDICEDEATLDYIETQMVERGITQEMIDQTRASNEMQMMADLERRIAAGAKDDLNMPLDHNGATSLHVAAANGYFSVVQLLIEHGVDVNVCDNDQWTPLHGVACWGNEQHSKVVELLVEAGAHLDAKTSNEETAFDLCDNTELLDKLNQLKDELANKQAAASNPDLLKRTQSKTNSRIHSVRRTSVRDKNQISRREAREEAMLRVDSNPTVVSNHQDNQGAQDGALSNGLSNQSGYKGSTTDEVVINGSRPDLTVINLKPEAASHHDGLACRQTDLDSIVAQISDGTDVLQQSARQNGLATGSQSTVNGISNESVKGQTKDKIKASIDDRSSSVQQESSSIDKERGGFVTVVAESSSSDKCLTSRIGGAQKNSLNQPANKNNITLTSSSSTNITILTTTPHAQEEDSHLNSNETACDQVQDQQHHQHIQSLPTLVPFSYTLSNLKKQRSDLRMRTTSIGGSTTTIIVTTNSNGSVSLNPKSPSIDDGDVGPLGGAGQVTRPGSPSTTFRKFSGEPSDVIGEDKIESRHSCCIVI